MSLVDLSSITMLFLLVIQLSFLADGGGIGLNYGLLGNDLPPPPKVISLVKSRNVGLIRLIEPNHDVLGALQNSGVKVIIGTLNADIPNLANDINFAKKWVQANVIPYAQSVYIRAISIGNEVNSSELNIMLSALRNLDEAVKATGYKIPVTTTIGVLYLLESSNLPSQGDFSGAAKPAMKQVACFLTSNGYPIMVTLYPYFAYLNDPSIPIQYALLNSTKVVVRDGNLEYRNLFDAMLDGVYAALEKVNGGSVEVIIGESGWPSAGNDGIAIKSLAQEYNQNLVRHVLSSGTPKKPGNKVETYILGIFNENQKKPRIFQNFGLYYPGMTEVYHIDF